MTQKQDKKTSERRSGTDRRRAVEPRKPEVAELDVSDSEWGALTEQAFPAPAAKKPPEGQGT